MAIITDHDLTLALLDIFEDDATIDQDAVLDALRAATVLTPADCKGALLDALDHIRKARSR